MVPPPPAIPELLETSPLFRELPPAHRAVLLARFVRRAVETGTEIIHHGQPGGGLYVVVSGELEVLRADERGLRVVFGHLGPGDICGEMSLLGRGPRLTSATVRAVHPTLLLFLPQAEFDRSLAEMPELRSSFEAVAAQRERDNDARLGGPSLPTDTARLDPSTVWLL
jgi:CRP/FNR family cyclic AMP-dependent transcriptional regulator